MKPQEQLLNRLNKYVDIAGQNPQGLELSKKVEKRWAEWLEIVEKAPWVSNWQKSGRYVQRSTTPEGALAPWGYKRSGIALAIYISAVWGFGIEGWLRKEGTRYEHEALIFREMLRLQGTPCSSSNNVRTYKWHEHFKQEYGILIPIELGELDCWLETLC